MFDTYGSMDGLDRVLRAKVQLQDKQPFFSYLLMNMKICREDTVQTMAVDNFDRIMFNEDFVRSLSEKELTGVLCHEVMHRVLNHVARIFSMEYPMLGNIAADLVVNQMLLANSFTLPEGCLIPNSYSKSVRVKVGNKEVTVSDLDAKSMEEVYEEIRHAASDQLQKMKQLVITLGDGTKMSGSEGGFDQHGQAPSDMIASQGEEAAGENNPNELSEKWKDILCSAATAAKQRGLVPAGMESLIGELISPKIPWRQKLFRYMTNQIFSDFHWARPHKKSMCVGVYMPSVTKESIEMLCHVDTSGSIGDDEMITFMTELYSILNVFGNIKMTLLMCDAAIQGEPIELNAQNKFDIIEGRVKRRGHGGTSHKPVVDWINDQKPDTRLFISLTDGYSDIEHCYSSLPSCAKRIILLPKEYQGMENKLEEYAEIIILDD